MAKQQGLGMTSSGKNGIAKHTATVSVAAKRSKSPATATKPAKKPVVAVSASRGVPRPTEKAKPPVEEAQFKEGIDLTLSAVDESNADTVEVEAPTFGTGDSVRSSLDSVTDRGVEGWVMITARPSHRCTVALQEDNDVISRAVASRYRADLESAGVGDGCYAFTLPMPRSLLDGEEHKLQIVELSTGTALNPTPIAWRSTAGTAPAGLTKLHARQTASLDANEGLGETGRGMDGYRQMFPSEKKAPPKDSKSASKSGARALGHRVLFDVSDLVYYIGHHPNLTGIQRVQSSIILAIVEHKLLPSGALILMSFNARSRRWTSIPNGFFISLMQDLLKPEPERLISFPIQDAREGLLPGATDFDGVGILDDGIPSTFCLLGAAWVQQDYFHRILNFKRQFGIRLLVTIHDLIPIYARETCDQGTALVFEHFLRRALRHTDHFLTVSEYTAKDLKRYAASLSLAPPPITVTRNGSSFEEFLPKRDDSGVSWEGLPDRYVLFVATIEGRKNHRLIFEIWRRMTEAGDDPPHLICVGRVGWKSEAFIAGLVETNYLDGKVVLLKEVSDAQLKVLYERCMFTLCPSLYEGWGLPVGESLAAGKVCVCSDRASIPEVAGDLGVYLDINDSEKSWKTIRNLITDSTYLNKLNAKVRRSYEKISWRSVAERIIAACATVGKAVEPTSPYALIPYSTEISFAAPPGRDADGIFGEDLVARVVETRKGMFLFEPLQEENFLKGEDARSGRNWGEPENWGTWLCHSGGELVFDLPPNDASIFYVYVRLRTAGVLADLRVRLSVNGAVVWGDALGDRPRNIMLRVRRKSSAAGGWRLRLHAEAQLTPEMRERILAIDGRAPTIGFERMIVLPEDDLKTRLDMLSALMI